MPETSGIIIFALWYLGIAFNYAIEKYYNKSRNQENDNEKQDMTPIERLIMKSQEVIETSSLFNDVPSSLSGTPDENNTNKIKSDSNYSNAEVSDAKEPEPIQTAVESNQEFLHEEILEESPEYYENEE
ncbi:unnamed protein product [Parnassius mnemosyne]|uniref:Uncharacterized protein n=1 Tax=Parnassius mnemosyne TaxID=213953 RepID=A0AAV1M5L8_9NEOP